MKIIRVFMLIFQYARYWQVEINRVGGKMPEPFVEGIVLGVMVLVESLWLGSIYIFVANVMLGVPIHQNAPFQWGPYLAYIGAMAYANNRLLGPKERIKHYKEIFDSWDKWRQMRWKLYEIFIVASAFAVFALAFQASRKMLVP
jgi:hypothetical protein